MSNKEAALGKAITLVVQGGGGVEVLLNSLRSAMYLDSLGYREEIVISAVLCNSVEEGSISLDEVSNQFGGQVRKLVESNTADPSIKERFERDKDLFGRCLGQGREALLVRSAMIFQESRQFPDINDREEWLYQLGRMKYFNNLSNELIRNEKPWKDLNEKYEKLKFFFK